MARHGASVIPTIGATSTGDESSRPPTRSGRAVAGTAVIAPWYGEGWPASAILLVNQPQSDKGQAFVDHVDRRNQFRQRRGKAAGGDHLRLAFHLLAEPADQALHQADVDEDDPGLHAPGGRMSDRLDRRGELDA